MSQGSPLPGDAAVDFLPDWRVWGQSLAQETSRPSVPKTVMSRPISAMIAMVATGPQPVISFSRATAGRAMAPGSRQLRGRRRRCPGGGDLGDQLAGTGGQVVDVAGESVDVAQQDAGLHGVVILELPVQGLYEGLALGVHLAHGQVRQRPWVTLPGDQGLDHVPA